MVTIEPMNKCGAVENVSMNCGDGTFPSFGGVAGEA